MRVSAGQPAKRFTTPALAHGPDRGLAGLGQPHRLDDDVGPVAVRGSGAAASARSPPGVARDRLLRAQLERLLAADPRLRPTDDHVRAPQPREGHEHQADRPRPDHRHRLPRPIQLSSTPRTTQASGSTMAASRKPRPSSRGTQVLPHDPGRDPRELRVGAVPEEQVVAQAGAVVRGSSGTRRRARSWPPPRAAPGSTPSTPGPTSSTTPATSWPKTRAA